VIIESIKDENTWPCWCPPGPSCIYNIKSKAPSLYSISTLKGLFSLKRRIKERMKVLRFYDII
jgi:hypothetical protein